jgi:hypothetical protein
VAEIAQLFLGSPRTRAVIDQQPGFAEALLHTCPELFAPPVGPADADEIEEVNQ